MGAMASQITSLTIVHSSVIQAQIIKNIKAPRHWPLCGEFTGNRWIPAQMAGNAENVSIWWRYHVDLVESYGLMHLGAHCFKGWVIQWHQTMSRTDLRVYWLHGICVTPQDLRKIMSMEFHSNSKHVGRIGTKYRQHIFGVFLCGGKCVEIPVVCYCNNLSSPNKLCPFDLFKWNLHHIGRPSSCAYNG